jgi:hypothetical protein
VSSWRYRRISTHTSFGSAGGVGIEGDIFPARVVASVMFVGAIVVVSEMCLAVGLRFC